MSIQVNTAVDLPYDYEDFGMTADELQEKYAGNGHPEYTVEKWRASQAANEGGYWSWVFGKVQADDEEY